MIMKEYFTKILYSARLYLWPVITLNTIAMSLTSGASFRDSILLAISLNFLASYAFIVNDVVDRRVDKINNTNRLENIPDQKINIFQIAALLCFISAICSVIPLGWTAVSLSVGIGAGLYLYSFVIRGFLLLANIVSAILGSSPLWAPLIIFSGDYSEYKWGIAITGVIFLLSREILLDLKDKPGDIVGLRRTIPIVFGEKFSVYLSFVLTIAVSLFLAIWNIRYVIVENSLFFSALMFLSVILIISMIVLPLSLIVTDNKHTLLIRYVSISRIPMLILPLLVVIDQMS